MWLANSISLSGVTLDFRSSGQALHRDSALVVDGQEVVNAVGLVDFATNPAQVEVCTHCGTPGCPSGAWVALRRLGGHVLWIPDFAGMAEIGSALPPQALIQRGALAFDTAAQRSLRAAVPDLPALEALPGLSGTEVARLVQWEAPHRVLGAFPDAPELDRELLLAADDGELDDAAAELARLLAAALLSTAPVGAVEVASVIHLFLDLPGTPTWAPLARSASGELALHLDGGFAVRLQPEGA